MTMGLPKLWSRPAISEVQAVETHPSNSDVSVIHDGDLAYTMERAGNGSKPSYQEAAGAPVESKSPLGYHVGWLTVVFLNVNQMIGTGIFSTRTDRPTPESRTSSLANVYMHSWNYLEWHWLCWARSHILDNWFWTRCRGILRLSRAGELLSESLGV